MSEYLGCVSLPVLASVEPVQVVVQLTGQEFNNKECVCEREREKKCERRRER